MEVGSALLGDEEFEVILTGRANDVYEVTKYRSKSTGLEFVHANIEGPIVNGYIVLATKAEDDAGLPHTLEHMIFLGSEEYPYKGVLDVLANKCYASGTNAWTDVDHTCYTMTTAGSDGFCRLLPIYMDHIFFPILSDSSYKTEVHHLTGEGLDGGVVYAELQAIENSAEEKSCTELLRILYPPSSGYHYQAGGLCKDVREKCNNDRVKDFHKKFYNPRNACLVVCGMVSPKDIFTALSPVISKLRSKTIVESWEKPWLGDVPEIPQAVEKTFTFPSDEDDECFVTVGFRGPETNEIEEVAALKLLFEYLTDSPVAPFQQEFVENDSPISSEVSYDVLDNSRTTFYFEFESVSEKDLKRVQPAMEQTLTTQVMQFDIDRMNDIIQKNYQEVLSSMENTPHESIACAVIIDFLYNGSDEKVKFDKRINRAAEISSFQSKPVEFWTEMIQQRILNQKWVTLIAKPSKQAFEEFSKQEETRVNERVASLGISGLEKLALELEEAIKTNNTPVPTTLLESVTVPSLESIHSHKIVRHQNPDWASDLKCNLVVDDIKSNFIYVSVIFDTSSMCNCQHKKKYLPLLTELLLESPILDTDTDPNKLIPFEEVVVNLERNWVNYGCSMGIGGGGRFKCGSFSHTFVFSNQMELSKVEEGFHWIRKLLQNTQWSADRIKTVATKMASDVGQLKRKGVRMVHTVLQDILYKKNSNVTASSLVRQQAFLKELAESLPQEEEKVKTMLDSIRKVLLKPENTMIHVACSLSKLEEMAKSLSSAKSIGELLCNTFSFSPDSVSVKRIPNQKDITWMKDLETFKKQPSQHILGLGSEDSAHLYMVAPGPTSHMDDDLPVLLTAMQYFCQTEGPFYQSIRGKGFAYGFSMYIKCSEGLIYFNLCRCTDIVSAFKAAQDTILVHVDGSVEFTEEYLLSAKSSLIFEYIEEEKIPMALASRSLCCYFREVPQDHSKAMIAKISGVELQELKPIVEKYLRPLFFQEFAASVVCQIDKVNAVQEGFSKCNKTFTLIPGTRDSFLEKWI